MSECLPAEAGSGHACHRGRALGATDPVCHEPLEEVSINLPQSRQKSGEGKCLTSPHGFYKSLSSCSLPLACHCFMPVPHCFALSVGLPMAPGCSLLWGIGFSTKGSTAGAGNTHPGSTLGQRIVNMACRRPKPLLGVTELELTV